MIFSNSIPKMIVRHEIQRIQLCRRSHPPMLKAHKAANMSSARHTKAGASICQVPEFR